LRGPRRKVALVERIHIGGTCLNDAACRPRPWCERPRRAPAARGGLSASASAARSRSIREAVKARKDEIVAQAVAGPPPDEQHRGPDLVHGQALQSPHEAGGRQAARGAADFINVGGRPSVPDWPGLTTVPYLTNITMMTLTVLPVTCS
jgi:pyruvate/2-oxoglutarate dehydrogenase complex dihydrolipoamide dehydrogenase (E3) component